MFNYETSNSLEDDKNIQFVMVNKCELNVYMVRFFMECTHVCAAQKAY